MLSFDQRVKGLRLTDKLLTNTLRECLLSFFVNTGGTKCSDCDGRGSVNSICDKTTGQCVCKVSTSTKKFYVTYKIKSGRLEILQTPITVLPINNF